MKKPLALFAVFLILTSILPQGIARADAAPPEAPPGTNLLPGESITQVRMVAETVTLTISKNPSNPQGAVAKTEAVFTMRNLGAAEEKMAVRFPLSFFNGESDGYFNFPEIPSIAVKVDGRTVPTRREMQPFAASEYGSPERDEIPWAVFDVTFPPNQDVILEVVYNAYGFGYYPYEAFKYILETGAGWNGTIGSAEIIVRLPYEVSEQNLDLTGQAGYGESTPGGVRSGNEIRWSFKDLEPTYLDNIKIIVVTPLLWEKILSEKNNVEKNPNDGEAWGRLGKAYKEVVMMPKGWLREDPAGVELYTLSKAAYERCLELLPNDPLWHYGYADLLWAHYQYGIYFAGKNDTEGILAKTLTALQTALALDPNNELAKNMLLDISYQIPQAVQRGDDGSFILRGLTATPVPPTPWGGFPTETPQPTPEPAATTQAKSTPTSQPAQTDEPATTNPLCGSAFLLPALFGIVFVLKRRK
jgi:tetratricopeptide (TPR) repeat protein